MRKLVLTIAILGCGLFPPALLAQDEFTLDQVLTAPFANNLVASPAGNRLVWCLNQRGKRNIWLAQPPSFSARQLTNFDKDDGGELSDLHFTPNGDAIVFVRGEGKDFAGEYANPTSNPEGVEQTVWLIDVSGGPARKIDAGHGPVVSNRGQIAYARGGQLWLTSWHTSDSDKPKQIFVRGKNEPVAWSPDGSRLLFVSDRGDHSFVGIYDLDRQSIRFLAPSVDLDAVPVWSPDGKQVAFVRQPAITRDAPSGYFIQPDIPQTWAIWVADSSTGEAREIWHSGTALTDSYPYMAMQETGGGVLNWGAGNKLVVASEADGWQHLYAIPSAGGSLQLLTPGDCEVEQWKLSPDGSRVAFNSNCGDTDRRHLSLVSISGGLPGELTEGDGIEWAPTFLSDGTSLAYFGSGPQYSAQLFLRSPSAGSLAKSLALGIIPVSFPAAQLAVPRPVLFKAADGLELHAQLFLPRNVKSGEKRPALIFLHGGPVRQMLLGWHYMYYYSNAYAMNEFLASRGYVVLAVNYRSGIGYGRAFREAPGRAGRGATEYQDVVAAGKYLQSRPDVDAKRVGLWGGSYGGYLTALGLGRNSDLFVAGVDFHGVHDWPTDNWEGKNITPELTKLAHDSSPVAAVDTWKSPVLFIHGDDDRNVIFTQTVDLVARLRARKVHVEQLIFPDEVHDFLLYSDWLKAYQAVSDFFDRQFPIEKK